MLSMKSKRKGMTLLEVIISIAILGIIIVPMSNMILTSVKTNKRGEDKQQAVYLAQQVLEAFKNVSAFEDNNGFTAQSFSLNGNAYSFSVDSTINTDPLTVRFNDINIGDYTLRVTLGRMQNANIYNNTATNNVSADYNLMVGGQDDSSRTVKLNNLPESSISEAPNGIYVYVYATKHDINLPGYNLAVKTSSSIEDASHNYTKVYLDRDTFNNNISLSFDNSYENTHQFSVNLYNDTTDNINVYVNTQTGKNVDYVVNNIKGTITTYNVVTGNAAVFSKNYNTKVDVIKDGATIYTVNSNISK
ncbi:type IV pilus modification PilV family protein [Clostridium fungisolvens]|uniref:Prepilin-type N-terminal cleavage/methylation domain-containing protein n=1 Tax=Clostridium fungisolvens TaxID=1604897 RepID=A0A6V8SK09_9CLOT|nr:prepilin-type N-terminal cleavage/methylation domain-containing protein [Clostridium fungisolvens]GFP77564.1 hypothetical protein bsdtw1_03722 [Clostridium fungisolvens]